MIKKLENSLGEERLAHIVRVVARQYSRNLSIRLAQYKVTFGQWTFLRVLWEQEGISQRELSDHVGVTDPTTHTAIRKLESIGLIYRRTTDDNKRRQRIFLTEKGRQLRQQLEPLAVEVNAVSLDDVDDNTHRTVCQALTKIYRNLAADEINANRQGKKVPPKRLV